MELSISQKAKENIIVVAHRGAAGGNIPCNTIAAYETALRQGADMLEVDISKSRDGELFLFHPFKETTHLNTPLMLGILSSKTVKKLRYVNFDRTKTQFGIAAFDDFLEQFKNRCYINIDKFWIDPQRIYEAIKRHGMVDQCLVKSKPSEKVFDLLENLAPELSYMPIVKGSHDCHEELLKRNINYVGVEVLFDDDSSALASDAFIDKMHRDGILVWVNSIIYDYRQQLAGGHSDDAALTESQDKAWGWLADKGFDFIQTDWPMMLVEYLRRTDKYYR